LAFAQAEELRLHGLTALALTPGFLRSEAMLDGFGVTEATWRDAVEQDPNFAASETPRYIGRAIAAVAADPQVHRRSGQVLTSLGLAEEYRPARRRREPSALGLTPHQPQPRHSGLAAQAPSHSPMGERDGFRRKGH